MGTDNSGFQIPWRCLVDQDFSSNHKISDEIQAQDNTFAQTLNICIICNIPLSQLPYPSIKNGNICNICLSQLPSPCIKNGEVTVRISEEDYLAGLEDCKTHLHGRIVRVKGDKPLTHLELSKKLDFVWNSLGPWKAIPLAKGFYEFAFDSLEDMRRVLLVESWNLNPEILRIFAWTKDFNYASMEILIEKMDKDRLLSEENEQVQTFRKLRRPSNIRGKVNKKTFQTSKKK